MFSYKKATDRAIAALNDNGTLTKILYIHDKFSLPRLTRDPAKDEIILRDLFETDELDPDTEFFEILPESRRGQTDRIVLCAGSGFHPCRFCASGASHVDLSPAQKAPAHH